MRLRIALAVLAAAVPLAAQAQYRCVDKDGKKHYGATIPPQCAGMRVEQLNAQGHVVRRIDPPAPAQPALSQTERSKLRADEATARRDRALLATYANEGEIDEARRRALRATKSVDAAAINARYDAERDRYRELMRLRREAPLRVEKGPTIVTPAPTRAERQRDQEHARRVAEEEAEALRRLQLRREEPPRRVLHIDPVAPTQLTPPRTEDEPASIERDEPIRFPGQRPGPSTR